MTGKGRKRSKSVAGPAALDQQQKNKRQKVFHRSHLHEPGYVLALGEGDVGQLGLGEDVLERSKPGKVDLPDPVVQVCAGGMHTVCLTVKGEVFTFGCNDEGALGRVTAKEGSETVPSKVDLKEKVVQVSAGDSHTAVLTGDGKVFIMGTFRDANGALGLTPTIKTQTKPHQILEGTPIKKIASGTDHLVCLSLDGDIHTLGCAEQGALGRVAECFATRGGRKGLGYILNPGVVHCKRYRGRGKVKFGDVWTGQYLTFAQTEDEQDIFCWGLNNYYQLGLGDMNNRFVPERVPSFNTFTNGTHWKMISSGQHHTVALDTKGRVYSLGRKEYGRLGLGETVTEEKSEPTVLPSLKNVKCMNIGSGTAVSFAIKDDGTVYSWGMGSSKQLGQDEEDDVYVPTKMCGKQLENRKAMQVCGGGQHTVVLVKDK